MTKNTDLLKPEVWGDVPYNSVETINDQVDISIMKLVDSTLGGVVSFHGLKSNLRRSIVQDVGEGIYD